MKLLGVIKRLATVGFNLFWGIITPIGIVTTAMRLKELNSPENRALAHNLGYDLNTGYPTFCLIFLVIFFFTVLIFKFIFKYKNRKNR